VRFVLCRGGTTISRDFERDVPRELESETVDAILADVGRLVSAFHDPAPDAMRRVVMAPTTPTWSAKPAELKDFVREARRLGIRLHSHLSETADYVRFCREVHDTTPLEFAARHEWIGPDVWFAHMVHLSEREIRLAGETGTGIAHCPASNCRLGSGIAPIPELASAGAPISIGVDGAASNESADMISEAHLAWYVHRAAKGPGAVSVEDVVHWGTRGGGCVLGLDRVGAIAPGYAADIAVYALDDPRYAGLHDAAIGPVASGGRPRLAHLFVGGRAVVENDVVPDVDLERLIAHSREAVGKMMRAMA
jgi:cytosine/adenosine deaminase-related metal-dependent hydrolase